MDLDGLGASTDAKLEPETIQRNQELMSTDFQKQVSSLPSRQC